MITYERIGIHLFQKNMIVSHRETWQVVGILPQIKAKMLPETTPPKEDKYQAQGNWIGNKDYTSRFCKNANECQMWKYEPGRKVVGFPSYQRFRALTKQQNQALGNKLKVYSSEIEKEKKIKFYYEKKH